MIAIGHMNKNGHEAYMETKNDPSLIIRKEDTHSFIDIPYDLNRELNKTMEAFRNFIAFPKSYRKMCIRWINAAKKADTRHRRITEVVSKAANGEKIGLK